jgi:hypothetical protein
MEQGRLFMPLNSGNTIPERPEGAGIQQGGAETKPGLVTKKAFLYSKKL